MKVAEADGLILPGRAACLVHCSQASLHTLASLARSSGSRTGFSDEIKLTELFAL